MNIIIEDGSLVANANSYVTVAEATEYCADRGLAFPTVDAEAKVLLVKAMDFLSSIEDRFQGSRNNLEQELSFPRGFYLFGNDISNTIPKQLKNAQCQLAFDASQFDLLESQETRKVIEEGVGALKVKYSDTGSASTQRTPTAALRHLQPLFNRHTGTPFFSTSR